MLYALTAAGLSAMLLAERRNPSVRSALIVGGLARLVVLVVALDGREMVIDVGLWFNQTGQAVLAGHDPALTLPNHEWNYLPVMPLLWAAGIALHLPWPAVGRLWPLLTDVTLIPLIGTLAVEHKGRRAMQYAVCPLAFTVSAFHGQLEPIMLALLVAGLLVLPCRALAGGGLLGLAVAVKTWPVLCALAFVRSAADRARVVIGAVAVVAAFAAVSVMVLGADPIRLARVLIGYSSVPGLWGWTGITYQATGHMPSHSLLAAGKVLLLAGMLSVGWRTRSARPIDQLVAVMLAFVVLTPGWGMQYALWPVPFLLVRPRRGALGYVLAASAVAGATYGGVPVAMAWLSPLVIAAALWALLALLWADDADAGAVVRRGDGVDSSYVPSRDGRGRTTVTGALGAASAGT